MKKLLILTLALILALSLAACGDSGGNTSGGWLGDITVGGSSNPSSSSGGGTSTPEPSQSTSGTSQQSGETIDSKIFGGWSDSDGYAYNFKADGICVLMGSSMSGATGKYYTSGGKFYITNIIEHYSQEPLNDKVSDYSFGSDQYGEYIMLKHFSFTDSAPDSNGTYKFYKRS